MIFLEQGSVGDNVIAVYFAILDALNLHKKGSRNQGSEVVMRQFARVEMCRVF